MYLPTRRDEYPMPITNHPFTNWTRWVYNNLRTHKHVRGSHTHTHIHLYDGQLPRRHIQYNIIMYYIGKYLFPRSRCHKLYVLTGVVTPPGSLLNYVSQIFELITVFCNISLIFMWCGILWRVMVAGKFSKTLRFGWSEINEWVYVVLILSLCDRNTAYRFMYTKSRLPRNIHVPRVSVAVDLGEYNKLFVYIYRNYNMYPIM